jgi:hypothetical protein
MNCRAHCWRSVGESQERNIPLDRIYAAFVALTKIVHAFIISCVRSALVELDSIGIVRLYSTSIRLAKAETGQGSRITSIGTARATLDSRLILFHPFDAFKHLHSSRLVHRNTHPIFE